VKDAVQIRDLVPAEPVQVLPLCQIREALRIFGRARIGRAEEFERQSLDEQDERVVEFLRAGLDVGFVSANPDQMNLVRIEIPI
jgi:hypothetical protein